ncbi:MAG: cation:proton antiporter [Candidatus Aenigmarchaeota archaeon]|nr:cation:proton antiporter [Candidatus Aenigmarchaeota archaeon]
MIIEYIFITSALLLTIRAILGPTYADRVISIDTLTNIIILFMVLYSINIKNPIYLDTALLFAMISYVGVIAIAKLVKK